MNRKEFLESKAILQQIAKNLKENPRFEFDYEAVGELKRRVDDYACLYDFKPYDWQVEYFNAAKNSKQRLLMAANQVGKTQSTCQEMAYHLTGLYPDWWGGARFKRPVTAWMLGYSGEQLRDVVQSKLLGTLTREDGFIGQGIIPKSLIDSNIVRSMTTGLAKDLYIKHSSGALSYLSLKSYSQGQHALMGKSDIDLVLIDEEPRDIEIYPQLLARTINGFKESGSGGLILLAFTPENGVTPLVDQFTNRLEKHQYLLNVTWDDAPHITEETKSQMRKSIPSWQLDMRSKGMPLMGAGLIYNIDEADIKCNLDKIPAHWPRVLGIDFGWAHPTALAWCAWDRDNDIFYVYETCTFTETVPSIIAAKIKAMGSWIPVSFPHDGLQHDKGSGVQLKETYEKLGVNMLPEKATFESGSNSVEAGIFEILDAMKQQSFKVFSHCHAFFREMRQYHRKDNKIVKLQDDVLCAARYAWMMRRFAKTKPVFRGKKSFNKSNSNDF